MISRWLAAALAGLVVHAGSAAVAYGAAAAKDGARIDYPARTLEGLVGNGRSVVKVRPDGYQFHSGGDGSGRFRLLVAGEQLELTAPDASSTFFPGGVGYRVRVGDTTVEILHGALSDVPYLVAFRVTGAHGALQLQLEGSGSPLVGLAGAVMSPGFASQVTGAVPFRLEQGSGELILAAGAAPPAFTFDDLRQRLEQPYREGLLLNTPSPLLDRAVPFCRFLLDLGFDGRLHVCEIFRWRDVWSRDLGSGLVPGAMASGRFEAARATIQYDLVRHAAADPRGLKVTLDPSQGGTAEGIAWLTRAVWQDYLLTGDSAALRDAARTLRPWLEAWIDRDPDERGLLVDVSEWMDHSRFFLFPDGARILYSNVLFAELLRRFAAIETALGDAAAAQRYEALGDRFVRGINAGLWDEANGMYDNLELWGQRDERTVSAENALAVLCGVAPLDRSRRALQRVREQCWRAAGSTTIVPPMTHVPAYIDHNFRFWPWWNAVEARARVRIGDVEGAVHLLERCSATLEDERYPGLVEELTTPEGVTEGGNAFLTAAGSYLDAVVEGLLGVEIVEPGCARLRVQPHVPSAWLDWSAQVPLPQGHVKIEALGGRLRVEVTDPRVQVVEVPPGTTVEGARAAECAPHAFPTLSEADAIAQPAPALAAPSPRTAGVLAADMLPQPPLFAGLPSRRVTPDELLDLDSHDVGALVIPGNALPRRTADGDDVRAALERYLERGGALVFYGATMHERGTMGEQGGVIEWYDRRPLVRYAPIEGWSFRRSFDSARIARDGERGLREGWQQAVTNAQPPDTAWTAITVPATWETHLGHEYDGWAWYRASFTLPETALGQVIVLDLGRIDDSDWTYVNGQLVGSLTNWQAIRHYRLRPQDEVYASLAFGGHNDVAVQVLDTGGGGGLFTDRPRVGVETDEVGWTPIDPKSGEVVDRPTRHAVVSWGPGGAFFNSWETARGAFGFAIEGHGVEFSGPLAGLAPLSGDVAEAFTDFAVSRPWRFQPLAFTRTQRHLLVPDHGERYPCMARLVDTDSGGEIVLIPASIAHTPAGPEVLRRLGIGGRP